MPFGERFINGPAGLAFLFKASIFGIFGNSAATAGPGVLAHPFIAAFEVGSGLVRKIRNKFGSMRFKSNSTF